MRNNQLQMRWADPTVSVAQCDFDATVLTVVSFAPENPRPRDKHLPNRSTHADLPLAIVSEFLRLTGSPHLISAQ